MPSPKKKEAPPQKPEKQQFDTRPYERPGLSSEDIIEIKQWFDKLDVHHLGKIQSGQLREAVSALGPDARAEPVYQLIANWDADGAGSITFQQFLHLYTTKVDPKESREYFNYIFSLFDDEKCGFISLKSLRRLVRQIDNNIPEADLVDMMIMADKDGDGLVSQQEFYLLMSGQQAQ